MQKQQKNVIFFSSILNSYVRAEARQFGKW